MMNCPETLCMHAVNPLALLDLDLDLPGRSSAEDDTGSVQRTDFDEKLPNFHFQPLIEEAVSEERNIKPKKVRQRLWTLVLSVVVACIPFLLAGCTLGFPSGALLDLTDLEERTEFKLTRQQADLFGVS